MGRALVVVDFQNDFASPDGALSVAGGDQLAPRINELMRSGDYDLVVATRDWHPADHGSFTERGGIWPVHCVAGTPGAQLHPALDDDLVDVVVDKGWDRGAPGYSGFESTHLAEEAWDNVALPIGSGQTISQPLVVARMCELLAFRGGERVLDVGTGSGYHAAVLAQLAEHVWSIERHPELSALAAGSLAAAGVRNVTLVLGDGAAGHPGAAPYDAINVAAAMGVVPRALSDQLAPGGRLVGPVNSGDQRLVLLRRGSEGLERSDHDRVRFVPLISDAV